MRRRSLHVTEPRVDAPQPANVVLVRPPMVTLPGSLATHGPVPPIGLAYIAAALRDDGHHVSVIDAPMVEVGRVEEVASPIGPLHRIGLSPQEIVDRIPPDSHVVGISNMFLHEWPQVREIAELVKTRAPAAFVVLGGETPTAFWEHILGSARSVDCCVLGEGDATIREVVARVMSGAAVDDLDGAVTRATDEGTTVAQLPMRLRDLRQVPRPAWDLFPLGNYWESTSYFGVDRGRSMPVLASRGCPYRCTFCSSPQMWTTRYVVRDPDDLADEIAELVRDHRVANVNFCDLTAITKRRWTLEFCDALEARDLGITWQLPVGTRSEALDAEVLQRLWDTGCRNITYAPESGSPRMLELLHKRVSLDHMLVSLRAAHRIGLRTHVNLIIGHPEERWVDLWHSLRFALRAADAGCNDIAPSIFAPYPGSKDYEQLVERGSLQLDDAAYYVAFSRSTAASRSYNPRMNARQLRLAQIAILAVFYAYTLIRRPSRLVEFVRSQLLGGESTYLEQMLRTRRQSRSIKVTPASEPAGAR